MMSRIPGIRRLLHIQRDRAGVERAVDDELRFHFDMTVKDLMNRGMTPDDARREAERRFGDIRRTRETLTSIDQSRVVRERRAEWWSALAQDLRYALRGMRRAPGFAAAVIVTLGLGIGANATMFGIVDRLLFRPPRYLIAPDRAARLYYATTNRGKEDIFSYTGYQRFVDLRSNTTTFDAMTPYYTSRGVVGTGDATREQSIAVSTSDLWKMFDVTPVVGRFFGPEDDDPLHPTNVLVLSYAYWQTEFAGQTTAIGSPLSIGQLKYTIIGVAPEGFRGLGSTAVIGFAPIATVAGGMDRGSRDPWYSTYHMNWFETFARRKPGVTLQAATADLTHAYRLSYERQSSTETGHRPIEIAKPRALVGPVLRDRGPNEGSEAKVATWLAGVAGIVLLIACANVANLLLARALRRRREIAVRVALGVSRGRLLMQLLTESLLLAACGGLAGIAIAHWGGGIMRHVLLDKSADSGGALNDPRVLGVAAALAAVAGLLTGLAPVLQLRRDDVTTALKAGSREGTVHRSRVRVALLVAQAALSVVLLVGAGLFLRSMINVKNIPFGYDAEHLTWVELRWRGMKVDTTEQYQLRQRLLDRVRTVPGVEDAAVALTVPFYSTWDVSLFVPGIDSVSKLGEFTLQAGSPEFFKTMGTKILRGRGITSEDVAKSPRVVVVSEAMAKKLWPNEDALGKTMRINSDTAPVSTVVGIAQDVRRGSLTEPEQHYYMPITQFNSRDAGIFVRTRTSSAEAAESIRRALQPLMPGVSYISTTPMQTILADETRSWKLGATMFTVFGVLALVLAAIGLYSVIAYNVTQRMHEMGVRVALGAQARDVVRLVVREGVWIVLPGIALGAGIALVAGRWVAPLLFEVSPKDPPVLVAVVATLIGVALVASWVPATRAARVDPNVALRAD